MKRQNIKLYLGQLVKLTVTALSLIFMFAQAVNAQSVEQIRWKSESQVRALHGEPNSIQGPIGTHASYTLWKYDNFSIAFANNRAFHLFDKNSLRKEVELEENRPQ